MKLEEPGHMLCALIFPDQKECELWNTAKIPKNIQTFFTALLPKNYTIKCYNAQLQVKSCLNGETENVYIVKQPRAKTLLNLYCQTWPYFFAYMRCFKKYSSVDILKFLSCLTDRQKTILIDAFNTALANRGKDVQYISEINDRKHFQEYVKGCDPLLNLDKSIRTIHSKKSNTLINDDFTNTFRARLI